MAKQRSTKEMAEGIKELIEESSKFDISEVKELAITLKNKLGEYLREDLIKKNPELELTEANTELRDLYRLYYEIESIKSNKLLTKIIVFLTALNVSLVGLNIYMTYFRG